MDKRAFLKASAVTLAGSAVSPALFAAGSEKTNAIITNSLTSIAVDAKAITATERKLRIAKAQQLMQQHGFSAIILEPGAAMDYFTGIQWWRSERLTSVVIPREGEIAVVCARAGLLRLHAQPIDDHRVLVEQGRLGLRTFGVTEVSKPRSPAVCSQAVAGLCLRNAHLGCVDGGPHPSFALLDFAREGTESVDEVTGPWSPLGSWLTIFG